MKQKNEPREFLLSGLFYFLMQNVTSGFRGKKF